MSTSFDRLRAALADRYLIERELGRGAMATVYLARDVKIDRLVAVKVLLSDVGFALGPERFRREIGLATKLTHPHILPIYDSGEAAGELYYVMPYVEGESLRVRLNRERQLSLDEALRITCEVASALDHSHRHGIIHRDIKPENILLEDGQALVADFGIARAVSSVGDEKLTGTGISLGTPAYMSPEQGMADPNIDRRSDIYSLGCVLYEMLAGSPPFTGRTMQALIARHSLDQVPSLTVVRSTIPEEVEDAVIRALAKVPADRFDTAAQFAEALRACQTGTYVMRKTGRRAVGKPKRDWRAIGTIAAVVVLLFAGAIWASQTLWSREGRAAADAGGFNTQRIAVQYFRDLSPDKRWTYLADGLSESLIDQLSTVSALDVISAGGVAQFRGTDVSRDSVARVLEAGTLVEGSLEPARGDTVQVLLRLVDGNSGAERNQTRVVESVADPIALRTKLSERLAVMLREWLRDDIRMRELREGTKSPAAWSLVQRAEKLRKDADALAHGADRATASRALIAADTLLGQAEALDPKWTEPIVLRGQIALRQEQTSHDPAEVASKIATALAHANRALKIDPRNPDALELRGTMHTRPIVNGLVHDQRRVDDLLREAQKDLRAAIAINPTQAGALNLLSAIYHQQQDVIESHNFARRAYEADAYLTAAPEILYRLYVTSYDLEQFPNSEKWCNELKSRFPRHNAAALCQLWIMTAKGITADPSEAWRRAKEYEAAAAPEQREYNRREGQIVVASVLARAKLADSARRVLLRARADRTIDPRGQLIGYEAFVRTQLGDKNEAVDLLQRYLTDHPEHRRGFSKANWWWWRDLQGDPRFKSLIAGEG
jgi:serine/threonine-protein kinase